MTERAGGRGPRARRTPLLATAAPGLGRMLRRQLDAIDGVEPAGTGVDGPAELVFFTADPAGRAQALGCPLADEVLAEVGRASRTASPAPAQVADRCWQPAAVERALSLWAEQVRPLSAAMSFRVSVRLLADSKFAPAQLRRDLISAVLRDKPRWRPDTDGQLEIRLSEWHDGQYVASLKLAGADLANPGGTAGPAILQRPSVTAAMLALAGSPGRAGTVAGTLLDPCCGTGAILAAARAAGWRVEGSDSDPAAVQATLTRLPGASVDVGDARELLMPEESVGACVSRLRAGQPTGPDCPAGPDWAATVLAELSRVTRSGGFVVVLAAELSRASIPAALRLRKQVPIRPPGQPVSIWAFRRA